MVPKGPKAAFLSFVFAIIGLAGCGTSSVQGTSSVAPTGYLAANTKLWTKSIAASSVPPAIPNQSNPPQDVVSAIAGLKTGGFATAGYTLGAYPGFTNPMQIAQAVAARYDAQGNQLWLMQLSSGKGDVLEAATTDTAGNIYVAGSTNGTYSSQPNSFGREALVAKFSSSGTRIWIVTFALLSDPTSLSAIAVDTLGGVDVLGLTTSPSSSGSVAFAAHIDAATGGLGWMHQYGDFSNILYPTSIIAGLNGDIYVTGSNLSATTASQSTTDVSHLDASTGHQIWSATLSSTSQQILLTCSAINSDGNPVVAGAASLKNSLIVGFGADPSAHAYIMELNAKTGTSIWATEPTTGSGDQITSLTSLNSKLYAVGNTNGSFATTYKGQLEGNFLMRFSATGTVDWVQQFATGPIVNILMPSGLQASSDSTSVYVASPSQTGSAKPLTVQLAAWAP